LIASLSRGAEIGAANPAFKTFSSSTPESERGSKTPIRFESGTSSPSICS
jgi:hypothetical protein